jgi:hypothetical protein
MTNLTNQDNVGNYYFGFRTNNFVFDSRQIQMSLEVLVDWINTSFQGIYCAYSFSLILPHPTEILTPPAIASGVFNTSKGRFMNSFTNTTNTNRLGGGMASTISIFPLMNTNRVYYCVLNSSCLNIFGADYSGNSLNATGFFISMGFVKNPIYSGDAFPRNCYRFGISTGNEASSRPDLENSNSGKVLRVPVPGTADPIANYAISCQTATPGANTTDLWLRDNDAPNKAIGSVSNVLKTTLNIPVGQIYRNTGVDPDGSNMNTWICVGKMGSESILMRVWTEGLV